MATSATFLNRVLGRHVITEQQVAQSQLEIATAGKRTHDERNREHLDAIRWHRKATLLLGGGLLVSGLLNVSQLRSAKVIPTAVVPVDSVTHRVLSATLVHAGPPEVDTLTLQTTLRDWVEDWRTVLADIEGQRTLADWVFLHVDKSDATSAWLTRWYQEHDPRTRAKSEGVTVTVNSVIPESAHTFMVVWTETVHPHSNGSKETVSRWRARITVRVAGQSDPNLLLLNPFGIYVTEIGEPQQEAQ